MRKTICIAACILIVGNAFLPMAGALRSNGQSSVAISPAAQVKSAIRDRVDTQALYCFEAAKINSKNAYRRNKLELSNIALPPVDDMLDDDVPDDVSDDQFYVSDTWFLGSFERTWTEGTPQASMNRISLALASATQRSITIVASASAGGVMDKMGTCIIRLQRYYKGRWVSVTTITNRYSYNTSYFLYSNVQQNATSGCYYRVMATFVADNGCYETCVTRTSRSIRCQ